MILSQYMSQTINTPFPPSCAFPSRSHLNDKRVRIFDFVNLCFPLSFIFPPRTIKEDVQVFNLVRVFSL